MLRTPEEPKAGSRPKESLPSAQLASVTRKRNELNELLNNFPIDRDLVQQEYNDYLRRVEKLLEACNELRTLKDFDSTGLDNWLLPITQSIADFRIKIDQILALKSKTTSSTRHARSHQSRSSCPSNTSSARIKLAQMKAKTQADKLVLKETEEIEAMELKLLQDKRKAEVRRAEVEAELMEKELDKLDEGDRASRLASSEGSAPSARYSESSSAEGLPRNKTSGFDNSALASILNKQNEIAVAIMDSQERAMLPKRELKKFDGTELTEYKTFIRDFERTIEAKCRNSIDKLSYLESYTAGSARKLVMSCSHSDPDQAYRAARKLLNEEYGNEFRTSSAFLDKLNNWPSIKAEDATGMSELALFLLSCNTFMASMSSVNPLNSPKEIMNIVKKLPFKMREAWRRKTHNLSKKEKTVRFDDLVDFVRDEASLLKQPIFSNIADASNAKAKPSGATKKLSLVTSTEAQKDLQNSTKGKQICPCCKKDNHTLDNCFFFKKKSTREKNDFIKRSGRCFACLKENHFSKNCPKRSTCSTCGESHPTALHRAADKLVQAPGELGSSVTSAKSCSTRSAPDSITRKVMCPVLPAKISVMGGNEVIVNVALDPCSSNSWMNEKLISELGAKTSSVNLNLCTMTSLSRCRARVLNNVLIRNLNGERIFKIPLVYTKPDKNWPFDQSDIPTADHVRRFPHLKEIPFNFVDVEIGLLIGLDVPCLIKPQEVVSGADEEPYASLHSLGWALNGPVDMSANMTNNFRTIVDQSDIETCFEQMYAQDFVDVYSSKADLSVEDVKWEELVSRSLVKLPDCHYQIDLPLRENAYFPDNRNQALSRFASLERRFKRDANFFEDYAAFMQMMITNLFVERVPQEQLQYEPGQAWFLVHHAVFHKTKKNIRVVFDCSLKYCGVSLNDNLLQGPDLTNLLLGVLLRFRQGPVASMADIEKMYYQVRVPQKHSNLMRFFWYDDQGKPVEYRLRVHVFGARSSPSVASFALRRAALDAHCCSAAAKTAVQRNFYVDDFLLSSSDPAAADMLCGEVKGLLAEGGFNLTGFKGNYQNSDLKQKGLEFLPASTGMAPDRVLGVLWNLSDDTFEYQVSVKEMLPTRRNILRIVSSIFDPLGIVGPVLLPARKLFQECCKQKLDWDSELPAELLRVWNVWKGDIALLGEFKIPRCIKPITPACVEVHVFCDGSETAYGAVAYLRMESDSCIQVSSPIMAKSRLSPINNTTLKTVPRIELCGARMGIIILLTLKEELDLEVKQCFLWSDSTTVLKYINNETSRFQKFVANKVNFIRSHTAPEQWHYVPSGQNPADVISRGSNIRPFLKNELWTNGPKYLSMDKSTWPSLSENLAIGNDDPEISKTKKILSTKIETTPTDKLFQCSEWTKLRKKIAWILRFKNHLRGLHTESNALSVKELQTAEKEILKYSQRKWFPKSVATLQKDGRLPKSDTLAKLTPFLDAEGLMRVGGRTQKSSQAFEVQHPIILPQASDAAILLVRYCHKNVGHLGLQTVLSVLRQKYWIVKANSLVRKVLRECLTCRKLHGRPCHTLMSDLPRDRVADQNPAFASTGIDYFGPFYVTLGRRQEKRYGVLFSCMASRAVHLEVAYSLSTDSFISALRRFMCRRGSVKSFRSDNGTNFVGGQREIQDAINDWNTRQIEDWLKLMHIEWHFRPPHASHFGGVWEREIRTVRNVMTALMNEQRTRLSDEGLSTLFCEVEACLNNRPLTEMSNDPDDFEALTPNHVLLWNAGVTFPPGLADPSENFIKKRWRQIQYLADLFWSRWKKQYLPLLQERQKWTTEKDRLRVGDLVLVTDHQLPRNHWPLGRVVEVLPDDRGLVRVARIRMAKYRNGTNTEIGSVVVERPIVKLILLR